MAARRVSAGRARARVALGLLAFLMVASAVILRRSFGAARARELIRLEARRTALLADRARLIADIGQASSLPVLGPLVERKLGLHAAGDRQVIRLPRPTTRDP